MKQSNVKYVLIATAMYCAFFSQAALAQSVGVFAMFEAKSEATQSQSIKWLEKQAALLGCAVRREGRVVGSQGDYETPDVNGFFFMECETSVLQNVNGQTMLKRFEGSVEHFALLEGPVSQFGHFGLAESGKTRTYVFKLGDYNNSSPKQRHDDLMKLDGLVKTREDRYKTEAFVRVEDAYGMKRPDEVVVLYYASAESGERFRENNTDIMKLVGKFNKNHLTQAGYLIASSNR